MATKRAVSLRSRTGRRDTIIARPRPRIRSASEKTLVSSAGSTRYQSKSVESAEKKKFSRLCNVFLLSPKSWSKKPGNWTSRPSDVVNRVFPALGKDRGSGESISRDDSQVFGAQPYPFFDSLGPGRKIIPGGIGQGDIAAK